MKTQNLPPITATPLAIQAPSRPSLIKHPSKTATPAAPDKPSQSGVIVTLSPAARGSADFDAAKVQSIKAAIARGTFKVNSATVADKLLQNAREALGNARGTGSH